MSGLSKMIADFFVRENVIEHEEYEIYKYGSDILIENIGTTIFLICLGFIFNKEISTLIFIAVFAGIRRYSGGYHAKTKFKMLYFDYHKLGSCNSVTEAATKIWVH